MSLTMRRPQSQPLLKQPRSTFKNRGKALDYEFIEEEDCSSDIAGPKACMAIQKRLPYKRCEEYCGDQYGLWRNEQMMRAGWLEKQLRARWSIEDLIDEQLNRFQAQYNQAQNPVKLKDIAQLLMPKWAAPRELASLSWFGDWRPSAIPGLLQALIHASSAFPPAFRDSRPVKTVLPLLINELRVEEAVIDGEMAEIQSNCIFHLPFGLMKNKRKGKNKNGVALACVYTEFRKVHQVLIKAQNLRMKAIHMTVKKVLGPTEAAEFLVAFAKVQDLVHQAAMAQKLKSGPASVVTTTKL